MTENSLLIAVQAGTRVVGGLAEVAIAQARTSLQDNVTKNPLLSLGVQLAGLVEDLVAGARTDPNMVLDLVRSEVERSVNRLGFATTAEVDALKQRIDVLQRALADAEARVAGSTPSVTNPPFGGSRAAPPRADQSANPKQSATGSGTLKKATAPKKATAAAPRSTPAKKTGATRKTTAKKTATTRKTATTKRTGATQKSGATRTAATKRTATAKSVAAKNSASPNEQAASPLPPEDSQ